MLSKFPGFYFKEVREAHFIHYKPLKRSSIQIVWEE
jgi:hypothetical protein